MGPAWVAELVRVLSQYAKVVGSIPGQNNVSLPLFLSKMNNNNNNNNNNNKIKISKNF